MSEKLTREGRRLLDEGCEVIERLLAEVAALLEAGVLQQRQVASLEAEVARLTKQLNEPVLLSEWQQQQAEIAELKERLRLNRFTVTPFDYVFQWRWGSNGEWHDYENGNHPIERRAIKK